MHVTDIWLFFKELFFTNNRLLRTKGPYAPDWIGISWLVLYELLHLPYSACVVTEHRQVWSNQAHKYDMGLDWQNR